MMKTRNLFLVATILAFTFTISSCEKTNDDGDNNNNHDGKEIVVKDNGSGVGTITWEAKNTYLLDGFVFVNDGQTLTISPVLLLKEKQGKAVKLPL